MKTLFSVFSLPGVRLVFSSAARFGGELRSALNYKTARNVRAAKDTRDAQCKVISYIAREGSGLRKNLTVFREYMRAFFRVHQCGVTRLAMASRSRRFLALCAVVCFFNSPGVHGASPASREPTVAGDVSRDLAEMDRLLRTVQPGQELVTFGDMMVAPSVLQAWRDELAGTSTKPRKSGAEPSSATPPADNAGGPWPRFPGGDVPYQFDPAQVANNSLDASRRQAFRDAVGEWAACARLRFIEIPTNITPPAHYIKVAHDQDRAGGIFIYGNGFGEYQVRYGPPDWLNRRVLCHEVGHGLGLYHEQQRSDRDSYVQILWNNLPPDQGSWIKVNNTVNRGPYDFLSVMHYSRRSFAPNPNNDTMVPLPAYQQFIDIMGYDVPDNTRTLSKLDREGMAAVYGLPLVNTGNVVTNTNDSGPGSLRSALVYAFDRANSSPPLSTTIIFQIPTSDPGFDGKVFTIKPTWGLFALAANTTVDGTSQSAFTGNTNPAGPEIVISGSALQSGLVAPGLTLPESNCTIRGLAINRFTGPGIKISGSAALGNLIAGCYIGTDATGETKVPNNLSGIEISGGAKTNVIGGLPQDRNIIAGNTGPGVLISGVGSNGNLITGNLIGLGASGTSALGNALYGIQISDGAQNNTVGGTEAHNRNFISANASYGIVISGTGTNDNAVAGNTVGANTAYGAAGNGATGVAILNGAQGNAVGGIGSTAGNIIRSNGQDGVAIAQALSFENSLNQNSIFNNTGRGVALYDNANNQQAFPTLNSAVLGGATNPSGVSISGVLNSMPNTTYRIEFFSNSVGDPSGHGEGEFFIGSTNVLTNSVGGVAFTASLTAAVPAGQIVTSKVMDPIGNTSEYSANLLVTTTDSDNDGMPDDYELAYGLKRHDSSDGAIDIDGDGFSNLREFRAGTNPKDARSRLSLSAITVSGGAPQISFQALGGKNYRLEYSNSLLGANWTFLSTIFVPSSSLIQISDKSAVGRSTRFYRMVVQH